MKKSKNVPAVLVVAVAAYLATSCGSGVTEVRRCVDSTGKAIPDINCTNGTGTGTFVGGGSNGGSSYGGGYYHSPHWVYGGSMSSGGTVVGSHSSPSPGASVSDSAGHSISRGGFGGHGGGGGGS